ncbi:MAG: DUF4340 domain-containing protein [Myxococcota bacterium]
MRNLGQINRLLGGALLVQIVLVAATSYARDDKKFVPPTKLFPEFVPDKVTKVAVAGFNGTGADKKPTTVNLVKNGTAWGIEGADGYPVDATKIDTLLKNVEKLKAGAPVVEKESFFKKLEVADDEYQRKVTLTHDGKEISFFLGSSPGFKRVHLRKAGEKAVVSVEGLAVWDVGSRAQDWVERAYYKIPENDVWAVNLKNSKGALRIEKAPGGEWAVIGAKASEAPKKSAIDDLVRKVATVNLEEPVGKAEKPEYGLQNPTTVVELLTGTSTIPGTMPTTTHGETLLIGAKNGSAYYVKSTKSEYVVTAPAWAIDPLTTKVAGDLFEQPKAADPKKPK